jgi:hypothetical protein
MSKNKKHKKINQNTSNIITSRIAINEDQFRVIVQDAIPEYTSWEEIREVLSLSCAERYNACPVVGVGLRAENEKDDDKKKIVVLKLTCDLDLDFEQDDDVEHEVNMFTIPIAVFDESGNVIENDDVDFVKEIVEALKYSDITLLN